MKRRDFVKLGTLLAAGGSAGYVSTDSLTAQSSRATGSEIVQFVWDGLHLSALEYSQLLMEMADKGKIKPDYYSNGGILKELEEKFAGLLGKERAVFLPTGTLANHLALRQLAGLNKRIIVQADSHIYNDSGDCAQNLSGLNLIPLSPGRPGFNLSEVSEVLEKSSSGRVSTPLGVISIESPVRRHLDRMFGVAEMQLISKYAAEQGIRRHLDGARLFVEVVHSGISLAEYGAMFDTVYISLWKCFNAASGAILAGPSELLDNLYHLRRMFGGGLPFAWPIAAVALNYVDGFIEEYKRAFETALQLFTALEKSDRFKTVPWKDGTHVIPLQVKGMEPELFRDKLRQRGVDIPRYERDLQGFPLRINPSLNQSSADVLAELFFDALQ